MSERAVPPSPTFGSSEVSVAWLLGADSLPSHVNPEHPALIWESQTRTYAELRARALALARSLRDKGALPGDRVAAQLLNRGETFELYFACAYAGLTFVPVSWRLGPRELGMILSDCKPRVTFSQPAVADAVRGPAHELGVELVMLEDDRSGDEYERMASGPPIEPPFTRGEPHLILYTSGTTGSPKGVMLGHESIFWFAFQQSVRYVGMDSEMVLLLMPPTFNTSGISSLVMPAFLVGGTVVVFPSRGWSAEKMSDYIDRHGATHTYLYPSMLEPFLEADDRQRIGLESVQFIITAGENVPPATLTRFRTRWSRITTLIGYGSTENGCPTSIDGDEIDHHPGSVGRVTMGMSIRIQDAGGNPLPPEQVGEIWVGGPSVVDGYWNVPELTASVFRDGWMDTGDIGFLDADGYLYLRGRSRDLIISKGQNIYPAEIENVLSENDDLLEFTVVGVPDEEFGEAVCAVVVAKPDRTVTADEVIDFVRDRLASYKKPRHVVFVDGLPRNPTGKVLKNEVGELAIGELGLVAGADELGSSAR
jgi:acyl-CoA synthetase (AMP-forming)/AMP-acid ligase II